MSRDDDNLMARKHLYVLVADSAMARLFEAKTPVKKVEELMDWVNPAGKRKDSDLYTDRSGSNHGGTGGYQSYDRETAESQDDARFARELGDYLEKARHKGQFNNLVLIAPPKFLGVLRNHLTKECLATVLKSIHKDLVRQDASEIAEHLDL